MQFNKSGLFNRIIESGNYNEFIDFATYMHYTKGFSLFNSALIFEQRKGVKIIENKENWGKKYRRYIKPEAIGIVIMKPFGPIDFLFDIEDTYGDDIPGYEYPQLIKNDPAPINENLLFYLKNILNKLGIYYSEKPLGTISYGQAQILDHPIKIGTRKNKNKEITDITTDYAIITNSNHTDINKSITILHELGHILCGHLFSELKLITVPDRRKQSLSKQQQECEAEKVCEFICRLLNIVYNSKAYLEGYLINGKEPQISLAYVIEAVDKFRKFI